MSKVFDTLLLKGVRQGFVPARTQESRDWFRKNAKKVKTNPLSLMKEDRDRLKRQTSVGSMYFFYYDAKHKKTLPYFDRFPLIFPIKRYKDGYLGLNLHYLPHPLRANLMDALYEIANNDKYNQTTKLKISYDILNKAAKFKAFRPCIKRYLTTHIKSKFMYVNPSEWDIALFLPVESFDGATKQKVWADSKKIIKKKK